MTKKTIREIIESYMGRNVPDEVKGHFERWMTSSDDSEEKDEALLSIWDNFSSFEHTLPEDPFEVLADAHRIENLENVKNGRKKSVWLWVTSVVAACMTVFAVLGWVSGREESVYLVASQNSKGDFVLPDGTKVWLNKGSSLHYAGSFDGQVRKVTLDGEGFFDVTKDVRRPFVVEAGDLAVKVLGTSFTVSSYDDHLVKVYLKEGSISASVPGNEDVVLKPNEAISYDQRDGSVHKFSENASDHTSWTGGKMEFVNKSFDEIIRCLEHWYCVHITCNDKSAAASLRLSMVVRQETLSDILSAIRSISDISYSIDDAGNVEIFF